MDFDLNTSLEEILRGVNDDEINACADIDLEALLLREDLIESIITAEDDITEDDHMSDDDIDAIVKATELEIMKDNINSDSSSSNSISNRMNINDRSSKVKPKLSSTLPPSKSQKMAAARIRKQNINDKTMEEIENISDNNPYAKSPISMNLLNIIQQQNKIISEEKNSHSSSNSSTDENTTDIDIEQIINDALDDDLLNMDPELIGYVCNMCKDTHIMCIYSNLDAISMMKVKSNLQRYSDINLDTITNGLKREEIRFKQNAELCNFNMDEPLTKRRRDLKNMRNMNNNDSFFKFTTMTNLTSTINNLLHNNTEYGHPMITSTHLKYIAIGMKNGSVFLFDHFQKLKVVLTSSDISVMGSVSALDFSHNGQNLIVGHQHGILFLQKRFL